MLHLKGGDVLDIGYRLMVNCAPGKFPTWSLCFDGEDGGNYGDDETDKIFNIAREFVITLANLQKIHKD